MDLDYTNSNYTKNSDMGIGSYNDKKKSFLKAANMEGRTPTEEGGELING